MERLCGPLIPVFWTISLGSALGLPTLLKEELAVGRGTPHVWEPHRIMGTKTEERKVQYTLEEEKKKHLY